MIASSLVCRFELRLQVPNLKFLLLPTLPSLAQANRQRGHFVYDRVLGSCKSRKHNSVNCTNNMVPSNKTVPYDNNPRGPRQRKGHTPAAQSRTAEVKTAHPKREKGLGFAFYLLTYY